MTKQKVAKRGHSNAIVLSVTNLRRVCWNVVLKEIKAVDYSCS